MITKVKQINISISSQRSLSVSVVRDPEVYSCSKFSAHNTWSTVTLLHARSPELICYSCTFISFSLHLPISPTLWPLVSNIWLYFCEFDTFIPHKSEIIQYLSLRVQLILLSIMFPRFIFVTNGEISFLCKDEWCSIVLTQHRCFILSSVRTFRLLS